MPPRLHWIALALALVLLLQCISAEDSPEEDHVTMQPSNFTASPKPRRSPANTTTNRNSTRMPSLSKDGFSMPQLNVTVDLNVGEKALASGAIWHGFMLSVFGYRFYRFILSEYGFMAGGIVAAKAVMHFASEKSGAVTGSWIAFITVGIVCAGLVYYFSEFVTGAVGGVLTAASIHLLAACKINPENPNVVLAVLSIILGTSLGMLALKYEKPVVIYSTSLLAGTSAARGVGFFAGQFPDVTHLTHYESQNFNGSTVVVIPSAWLAYMAGIVLVTVLGMIIQFQWTAKKLLPRHLRKHVALEKKLFGKKFRKHHRHSYAYHGYGPGHHRDGYFI